MREHTRAAAALAVVPLGAGRKEVLRLLREVCALWRARLPRLVFGSASVLDGRKERREMHAAPRAKVRRSATARGVAAAPPGAVDERRGLARRRGQSGDPLARAARRRLCVLPEQRLRRVKHPACYGSRMTKEQQRTIREQHQNAEHHANAIGALFRVTFYGPSGAHAPEPYVTLDEARAHKNGAAERFEREMHDGARGVLPGTRTWAIEQRARLDAPWTAMPGEAVTHTAPDRDRE